METAIPRFVVFFDGSFEAAGAAVFGFGIVFGAATFAPGVVFGAPFGAVFAAVFFAMTGMKSRSSSSDAVRSRCGKFFLGFGVGLTFVSSAVTLVSERVARDMEDWTELAGERTCRGDRGGDAPF